MTTKTIKTILFAALFAAMILPFSGMQSAQASERDGSLSGDEQDGSHIPDDAEYDATKRTNDSTGDNWPDDAEQAPGTHKPDGEQVESIPDGENTSNGEEVPDYLDGSHGPNVPRTPIKPNI